jgi:hypothetical protein
MECIAKKLHNQVLTYEDKKSYSGGRFVSTPKTKMVQVQLDIEEAEAAVVMQCFQGAKDMDDANQERKAAAAVAVASASTALFSPAPTPL